MERFNTIGPYLAEAIATFTLVFAGCGAVVITTKMKVPVANVPISFSFGLALMVMIYAVGHISGGHVNPAVTLSLALTRHFPFTRLPFYWLAQLIGATIAALILKALFGDVAHLGTTLPAGSDGQSLVLEIVMTFFLVFVIMAVATDYRAVGTAAALAIGFTLLMDAFFGGPISGASVNPARSFGPALVSNTWAHFWVYVVGPFVGGALGAFAYELARGERPKPGEPVGEAISEARK